jgi:hypothetical protein
MRSRADSVDQAGLLPPAGDVLVFEEGGRAGAIIGPGELTPGTPSVLA